LQDCVSGAIGEWISPASAVFITSLYLILC